jgi:hypothetical protein
LANKAEASKPAKIKNGGFTASVKQEALTAKVTAKFLADGKESGIINATAPVPSSCTASFPYSTQAS